MKARIFNQQVKGHAVYVLFIYAIQDIDYNYPQNFKGDKLKKVIDKSFFIDNSKSFYLNNIDILWNIYEKII